MEEAPLPSPPELPEEVQVLIRAVVGELLVSATASVQVERLSLRGLPERGRYFNCLRDNHFGLSGLARGQHCGIRVGRLAYSNKIIEISAETRK